ncbi:MAG: nucleotidyltransferase, partial [Bacteroidales bacterium]|nr:nucleotidyltransferase [Bacteroidales bacterium]
GTVSRGVCTKDSDNYLQTVVERTSIAKTANGAEYEENGEKHSLDLETLVSMNFFGFTPDFFTICEDGFKTFLQGPAQTNIKAEFFIPLMVNKSIENKEGKVKVLSSEAEWFGVTYKEDKPDVMNKIVKLIEKGIYPRQLWQ